ncbi:MAG: YfhO family protein [Myxococcota bacterium]|nr:YfhO family protein [Myxococcota bacterium]
MEKYKACGGQKTGLFALYAALLSAYTVLLKPSFLEGGDYLDLHQIYRAFWRQALELGVWPHWNPHTFLGRPFAADIESGVYYPPNALHLVFSDTTSMFLNVGLHTFLLCFFAYRLLRVLDVESSMALLFALAMPLLGPWRGYYEAGQIHYAYGLSYMPAFFYFVCVLTQQKKMQAVLGLSWVMCFALLGSHPQIFWTLCMGSGLFLFFHRALPRRAEDFYELGYALLCYFGALLLAGLMSAVGLLPFLEFLSVGSRNTDFSALSHYPMDPNFLASLFTPIRDGFWVNWTWNLYAGVGVLVLGLAGFCQVQNKSTRALLLLSLIVLGIALGQSSWSYQFLAHVMPGLSAFRLPCRFAYLLCFALFVSAALSANRMLHIKNSQSILFVVLGMMLFWLMGGEGSEIRYKPDRTFYAIIVTIGIGLWFVLRFLGRKKHLIFYGLFFVLLTGDLMWASAAYKRTYRPAALGAQEDAVVDALTTRGLIEQDGVPPRLVMPYGYIRSNIGMTKGFSNVDGFSGLQFERVWYYLHESLGLRIPHEEPNYINRKLYEMGPLPYAGMSLVLGLDSKKKRLVVRSNAEARAYLVGDYTEVTDFKDATARMKAGHAFMQNALLEDNLRAFKTSEIAHTPVEIVRFGLNEIVMDVASAAPAILIVAESWYPGWKIEIDGQIKETFPANAWMRGALVPQGTYRLRMFYDSTYFVLGFCLSLCAWLFWGYWCFRWRR